MALTKVPFSAGDSNDTLTSSTTILFDSTASNMVLAESGSPTFTSGSANCLVAVSNAGTFGAAATQSAIIASSSGTNNATNGALIACASSTVDVSNTRSIVLGGSSNVINSTGTNNAIVGGQSNTMSTAGTNCLMMASGTLNMGGTGAGNIMIGSNTIRMAAGVSTAFSGIYNCLGDNTNNTGIRGTNTYCATIASNLPFISATGSYNAIIGVDTATISGTSSGAIIAGGHTHTLAGNYSAILGGENNTISAANATAIGKHMTVSAAGSLGYCDHTLTSTLSTADAVGFYVTNGAVISDTGSVQPNSKSILTLNSTTKGFSKPGMTTTQRNAIASPPAGLEVFDTTLNLPFYYNGTSWISPNNVSEFSFSLTINGPWASPQSKTINGFFQGQSNSWVTLSFPQTTATATHGATIFGTLPGPYRPAVAQNLMVPVQYADLAGGAYSVMNIDPSGDFIVHVGLVPAASNPLVAVDSFSSSLQNGLYAFTIQYYLL